MFKKEICLQGGGFNRFELLVTSTNFLLPNFNQNSFCSFYVSLISLVNKCL